METGFELILRNLNKLYVVKQENEGGLTFQRVTLSPEDLVETTEDCFSVLYDAFDIQMFFIEASDGELVPYPLDCPVCSSTSGDFIFLLTDDLLKGGENYLSLVEYNNSSEHFPIIICN